MSLHNYNIQILLYDINYDYLLNLLFFLISVLNSLVLFFQINLSYLYYNKPFMYSFYYISLDQNSVSNCSKS